MQITTFDPIAMNTALVNELSLRNGQPALARRAPQNAVMFALDALADLLTDAYHTMDTMREQSARMGARRW